MAQLTAKEGALAAAYRYDAFGNTSVQDYIGNITGNKKITENYTRNPYTYNAEYTDASTGNQYLRARYYSPETGNFFTEDSYLGSLLEPLERNLYTYAENDPVNRYYGGNSGGGTNGNTSYNYVKYRKTTPYKMTIGGKTRYFQTKAEMNTIDAYETITNAPDIYALEDDGINIGGAVAGEVLGILAYAGGDIVIAGDVNSPDKDYYGVTGAIGVGTEGKEIHIEMFHTKTDWSTNISDLFK